jgi:hypothetical protein
VRERSQLKVLAIAVAAAAITGFAPAMAAPLNSVTLEVERSYDPTCSCYRLRFHGVISPRARNEYVALTQRKCGFNFATSVAGASTQADGSWVARSSFLSSSSATYRARWGRHVSRAVIVRPRMRIQLMKLGAQRYRLTVSTGDAQQKMAGRFVELQRLAAGRWKRVRRTRLTAERGEFGTFLATFTVRRHGLRMRIVVPEKSAAPCFAPALSQTFVS